MKVDDGIYWDFDVEFEDDNIAEDEQQRLIFLAVGKAARALNGAKINGIKSIEITNEVWK